MVPRSTITRAPKNLSPQTKTRPTGASEHILPSWNFDSVYSLSKLQLSRRKTKVPLRKGVPGHLAPLTQGWSLARRDARRMIRVRFPDPPEKFPVAPIQFPVRPKINSLFRGFRICLVRD